MRTVSGRYRHDKGLATTKQKLAEKPYLVTPPVNSALTSISFPDSSRALERCTVANIVTIPAQTFCSARCFPGQMRLRHPSLTNSGAITSMHPPAKTEGVMNRAFCEHPCGCEMPFGNEGHRIIELCLVVSNRPTLAQTENMPADK